MFLAANLVRKVERLKRTFLQEEAAQVTQRVLGQEALKEGGDLRKKEESGPRRIPGELW